jgi:hypothetical protein
MCQFSIDGSRFTLSSAEGEKGKDVAYELLQRLPKTAPWERKGFLAQLLFLKSNLIEH